jgi:hypothetical protein
MEEAPDSPLQDQPVQETEAHEDENQDSDGDDDDQYPLFRRKPSHEKQSKYAG